MEKYLQTEPDRMEETSFASQAFGCLAHSLLAVGVWLGLMFVGSLLKLQGLSHMLILAASFLVPLLAGFLINKTRQDTIAAWVGMVGVSWVMIVALWVLDMPTGPNACYQCEATDKLVRSFLSVPSPSGLLDNDAPFLGAWPAAALIGYSIGARLALNKQEEL